MGQGLACRSVRKGRYDQQPMAVLRSVRGKGTYTRVGHLAPPEDVRASDRRLCPVPPQGDELDTCGSHAPYEAGAKERRKKKAGHGKAAVLYDRTLGRPDVSSIGVCV